MGQWIDFKALRSKLKFAEVLNHYGARIEVKDEQAQGPCPLPSHRGERRPTSFSANLRRGIWQCFGCGAKGNVLDFAIYMERGNPRRPDDVRATAVKLIQKFEIPDVVHRTADDKDSGESYDQETTTGPTKRVKSPATKPASTQVVKVNEPLDFELKGLQPDHPYLLNRGFTPETIAKFGPGYCSRGLMAGRIAIPLHDPAGNLVGYAGRIVDDAKINKENPKYKFPNDRERGGVRLEFRMSELLYNAHRLKAPVDRLVIVQGFPSVWWLDQAGIHNVVALMEPTCNPKQAEIIATLTTDDSRIVVLSDCTRTEDKRVKSVLSVVAAERFVRWVRTHGKGTPLELKSTELQQLLNA